MWFLGCDKSTVSLHWLCWWFLGITPNMLKWVSCKLDDKIGPTTRESFTSAWRYSSTTLGCEIMHAKFCLTDFNTVLIMESNSETFWRSLQKEMNQVSVRIATQKVTPCRQIKRCWNCLSYCSLWAADSTAGVRIEALQQAKQHEKETLQQAKQ